MTRLEGIPSGSQVAGVDEVGRGCLFGPVFAAAVVLDQVAEQRLWQAGLTDSKKLSAKRRGSLVPLIEHHCLTRGLGQASAHEIDAVGIRRATERAMLRALQKLEHSPNVVLVDGNLPLRLWSGPQKTLVGGDSRSAAIGFRAMALNAMQAMERLCIVKPCWPWPLRPCIAEAFFDGYWVSASDGAGWHQS